MCNRRGPSHSVKTTPAARERKKKPGVQTNNRRHTRLSLAVNGARSPEEWEVRKRLARTQKTNHENHVRGKKDEVVIISLADVRTEVRDEMEEDPALRKRAEAAFEVLPIRPLHEMQEA